MENINIADSEWKKVAGYIEKGSDFKKVGTACRKNNAKLQSRYLILNSLGLTNAAKDLFAGAGYWDLSHIGVSEGQVVEIPEKWQHLAADAAKNYATASYEFEKAHRAGPLKQLSKLGIEYVQIYCDGSGNKVAKEEAAKILSGKIPTYRPSYRWVGNNGLRWDCDYIIVMKNGKMKSNGLQYFGYVAHTLESGAPNPGYAVFDIGTAYCSDDNCWNVNQCMDWIKANVIKA